MGANNSAELLELPLQPQPRPVRSTDHNYVAEVPTKLKITPPNFSYTLEAIDTETDQSVFTIKTRFISTKRTLMTTDGRKLMTIRAKHIVSSDYFVYEGGQTSDECFSIELRMHLLSPMVVYTEFTDRYSGSPCRLLIEGNANARVVIIFLERGEPTLSPVEDSKNYLKPTYQAVGRIHRPKTGMLSKDDYFIEIAQGVDMAIVLMLWMVRYDKYVQEQLAAAGKRMN